MFIFAFLIGIYSYLIFFLGIAGWLYKETIIALTILFLGGIIVLRIRKIRKLGEIKLSKNKLLWLLVILFGLQTGVNFIGALGPELAFDALWYHLTLPKLWLHNHSIDFIPGGLLYYSVMPKLGELLYVAGLSFGNEIFVKVIHWGFGLLTCLALYLLARKFVNPFFSFLAVIIFYANLVVAWESITAYVDLIRAFFEVMALWAFINWVELKKQKWLVWSAVMLGFAMTTKVLAIGSLVIFILLIGWINGIRNEWIKNASIFSSIALAVPLPWFVLSYLYTGNPVYPFFSGIYPVSPEPFSLFGFFGSVWEVLIRAADPISPVYLIMVPVIIFLWRRIRNIREIKVIGLYSLLAVVVWYFTPRTGGGRFLLPYLPVFSLLCAFFIAQILKNLRIQMIGKVLVIVILLVSLVSIGYRAVANSRYLPVIFGKQTKDAFLTENLNFSFGDFYDTDGYFAKTIKPTDVVLLYGFHNLYYVDFSFIDASYVQEGDSFNYIATQNADLPEEFIDWQLIYENEQTMVKLYKASERLYTVR